MLRKIYQLTAAALEGQMKQIILYLEIEKDFVVYGVTFYSCGIDYLLCPNIDNPIWIPANLCKIKDSKLLSHWIICVTYLNEKYKILYGSFKIQSIITYAELVTSISHYVGIIERETHDMEK